MQSINKKQIDNYHKTEKEKYLSILHNIDEYIQGNVSVPSVLQKIKEGFETAGLTMYFIDKFSVDPVEFYLCKSKKNFSERNVTQFFIWCITYEGKPFDIVNEEIERLESNYQRGTPEYFNAWRTVMFNLTVEMIVSFNVGTLEVQPPRRASRDGNHYSKMQVGNGIFDGKPITRKDMILQGLESLEKKKFSIPCESIPSSISSSRNEK